MSQWEGNVRVKVSMHECTSEYAALVNAEVDSMGGIVDGGVGIGTKTSPRRAAIEKAQAELRQEYDVREERRKELDFLEKGGNPLDFRIGHAASLSVQSTSLTDQHPEQFVNSEAKDSFAITASPRGDSVESSGRPGAPPVCEPNSADNLMLFDGENEFLERERNSLLPDRSNVAPSEQSSQLDGRQNAKEYGDSAAFGLPKKAYKRRNRSRPNRDGTRSCSTDVIPSRCGLGSCAPSHPCPKDVKGFSSDADCQKKETMSSNCCPKPTSPKANTVLSTAPSKAPFDVELDRLQAVESTADTIKVLPDASPDVLATNNLQDGENDRQPQVNDEETSMHVVSQEPEFCEGREQVISSGLECVPSEATTAIENQAVLGQINGFKSAKGETKGMPNEQNSGAAPSAKGIDSESSCTQTSLSLDGNNDIELCTDLRSIETNGVVKEPTLASGGLLHADADEFLKVKTESKGEDISAIGTYDKHSVSHNDQGNGSIEKIEELNEGRPVVQNEVKCSPVKGGMEIDGPQPIEMETNTSKLVIHNSMRHNDTATNGSLRGSADLSAQGLPEAMVAVKGSAPEQQINSGINLKLASKEHEDSVLEEARIIEAKRKRIAELSVGTLPLEGRQKSRWDFVLEEMAWLANDFAQERMWKIATAAQICHRVAIASRLRLDEQISNWKAKEVAHTLATKEVAHTLANAVIGFWHSAEEAVKEPEMQYPEKDSRLAVVNYAMNYLKHDSSHIRHEQAEAPTMPDRIVDVGIVDASWEDHLTEENLFYAVPPGAMEIYRNSIESHLLQFEKIGNSMQEVETSGYDAVAELESQLNACEEDEGETSTYFLPGVLDGSNSSKFAQKRRKNFTRPSAAGSYEGGVDLPFTQCTDSKLVAQHSVLMGKRPANSLNVSIPTKRVRTASRQRVLSPFSGAGTSGCVQAPSRNDASSGDTNSFQDDHSTLNGGSQIPNSLEVESVDIFEDSAEVSMKLKKKKKAKHLGSTYEQRWQVDSNFHNEQRDHSRKRLETHQFQSNGSSGLCGQPIIKKPKIMRQPLDNSLDNIPPMSGSIPSPVASQMSNMSNPNKLIRMLGGRDRGRKSKALKMPAGQPGSGSPWSLFEDQALVVLVHDMGPNWELVSDAINSTLQFKCIFRKPKECRERHKILMDRTTGDGADSAEDSGSSQPYPSTLPGIPKGSARQLFQRLQGPMEEDTLKSHFEKIIMIGQKNHHRRTQNDCQDPKQLQQPHNSHSVALSKFCPNNLNGGILTPLDLCDASVSSPEVLSLGSQGPHSGGLAISSQGAIAPMLPVSGANPSAQGSSNMVIGSNFPSPSGPLNPAIRDGRYDVPRSASLSIDEQQKMQQYNQMLSGRGVQQSNLSVPGALPNTDRGVRMVPGGNGMGFMCGMNRSMPMARPAYQPIPSSSMLNSGSMLTSGMMAMPSPVNMHSGGNSSQGNSMLRPRDALHMMRPGQSPEHQRQTVVPDLQMQVSQGNSQGIPPFGGLSSPFSNQTAPPPMQSFPLHQQTHPMSPQQSHMLSNSHHPHHQGPNHATVRLAKERQQQQRLLQQQQQQQPQQQFSASTALMQHVQPQPQLSISSPLHNSPQIPSQSSSPSVSLSPVTALNSMTPMTQQQQKHHMPPHGLVRNTQAGGTGVTNQMGKQRRQQQQQQFQQAGRHNAQQRQQSQSQQQAKLMKGGGRGNMMMHQNVPIDPSLLNGLSSTQGSQSVEKGDPVRHLMQGQGLYSAPGVNSVKSPNQLVHPHSSNQTQPQQKIYPSQALPLSKQLQQMPSHTDNTNLAHVPNVTPPTTMPAAHQTVSPLVVSSANNQLLPSQPHQKAVNRTQQTVQRVLQHNRQVNSESPSKLQVRDAQSEQLAANNASQMCTKPVSQTSVEATNIVQVVSSTPLWKTSEQSYNSVIPNSAIHLSSVGTKPLTSSAANETIPPTNQGLAQRQSSGSLSPLVHDGGSQWQQQPSQPQLPITPPQQQSQQQPVQSQLLQAGSSSLYVRPTSSRLE